MAQVILIEDHKTLHELLAINLATHVGVELIPRENAKDAISLLDILPSVPLIICRAKVKEEDTADMLLHYIDEKKLDTDLIVMGEVSDKMKKDAVVIEQANEWEQVIKAAAKILGVTEETLSKKVLPDYIPIPVHYFLPLEVSCCDVYIRIKKSPNEFQFVKRIHNGDNYSKSMIKKYLEQGLREFYIPKDQQNNFTTYVSNRLVTRLEDPNLDIDEQIEVLDEGYNIAVKEIKNLGFTSSTIQMTDAIIDSMVKTFDKSKELSPLLHKVLTSKTGYMYQLSHLTTVVAAECIKNIDWDKKNKREYQERLAFASFFNDISLVDVEELSKIHTYEELENSELSDEDWDLVFNHALEGSVLIKKHPEAPIGVERIILQHHGTLNGKGFATKASPKLTPLSRVFWVAETFCKQLLAYKESPGKPYPIIRDLYEKFPEPEMQEIISALEQTLSKYGSKKN